MKERNRRTHKARENNTHTQRERTHTRKTPRTKEKHDKERVIEGTKEGQKDRQ